MKNLYFLVFGLLIFGAKLKAQDVPLTYYLPDITYDSSVPTPKEFLGYQIGDWHISHDQLNHYLRAVEASSDRAVIEDYARSHEGRPLFAMVFSSNKNMTNLEEIKKDRQNIYKNKSSKNRPIVIYQGYSIHGNESSGANAAALMAYYMAAGQSAELDKLRSEAIVIIDPCFNPDGLHRFSTWANSHKSKTLVADPHSREFHEVWPGGRTNHYWFDLNRDWLPAVHPESQGRLAKFHEWKPNILTDHHEMGSHNTYFFQPGIPSRTNPITPAKNQDLTYKIAEFHAAQLDEIGSLYYSQESFDDFYYGKGSTYPDVNGCIGILFEQASARGHLRETENGLLSFPFTIRNQVATSLSTQKAGLSLKKELIDFQDNFYAGIGTAKLDGNTSGYSFKLSKDRSSVQNFIGLLQRHQIDVYPSKNGDQFYVPMDQAQRYLIKTMFEKNTSFVDSLFYDVSTWTMPLAYNLESASVSASALKNFDLSNPLTEVPEWKAEVVGGKSSYAYAFEWDDHYAPRLLYKLQSLGLRTKVSNSKFSSETSEGKKEFNYGSIIIPIQNQELTSTELYSKIKDLIRDLPIDIYNLKTGFTPVGVDLGSPSMGNLKKPEILLVGGDGASSYDVGEVWHLLDQRYEIPVTILESKSLGRTNLDRYNVIILVNGNYSAVDKLMAWTKAGGTLITCRGASQWAANQKLLNAKIKTVNKPKSPNRRPYEKASHDHGAQFIGGAIFEISLDLSHPIAYGYRNDRLPIFKKGRMVLETSSNPYATPAVYTESPLMSGYISKPNLNNLKGTAAIIISGHGRGRTIGFTDNPNFRGFWYGTNKLFANAIFFGHTISRSTME